MRNTLVRRDWTSNTHAAYVDGDSVAKAYAKNDVMVGIHDSHTCSMSSYDAAWLAAPRMARIPLRTSYTTQQ